MARGDIGRVFIWSTLSNLRRCLSYTPYHSEGRLQYLLA